MTLYSATTTNWFVCIGGFLIPPYFLALYRQTDDSISTFSFAEKYVQVINGDDSFFKKQNKQLHIYHLWFIYLKLFQIFCITGDGCIILNKYNHLVSD